MASGSITASVTTFALTLGTSTSYADKTLAPSVVAYATTGNTARMNVRRVAATGSFTKTGNATRMNLRRVAAKGSFVLTGQALTRDYVLYLTGTDIRGDYFIAGNPVGFLLTGPHTFLASVTPFTLTGRPINVDHEWRLTTNVTSLSVTGRAATITYGGVRKITGTPTAFTATGNAAGLSSSKQVKILSDVGAFTLAGGTSTSFAYVDYRVSAATRAIVSTGNAANLLGSKLSAATGSFVVSGKPANLSSSTRKIFAATGTFAETGNAANLSRSSTATLSAAKGTLATDGGTSTSRLYTDYGLSATKGAFGLAGQSVGWGGYVFSAASGTFLLTGKSAVSARYDYHLKGTFTLTGRAIQVKYGIAASTVSVVLSGNAATLIKPGSHVLSATTGNIIKTGNSANLLHPRVLTAVKGTLTETGRAATLRLGEAFAATVVPVTVTGRAATLQRSGVRVLTAVGKDFTLSLSPAQLNLAGVRLLNADGTSCLVTPGDATLLSASTAWISYPYIANAADTSVRWVHLYEIDTPSGTLRWTDDLLPVIFGGITFDPYVVAVDSVSTEQGLVASGTLTIGNADNLFGNYIFENDMTGSVVKIWQAWMNPFLPTQISASTRQVFMGRISGISLSRSGQDSTATIALGPYSDPSTKIFPPRMVTDLLRR